MNSRLKNRCVLKGGTGFPESLQGMKEGEIPFIKVSDMTLQGNEKYITVANNYVDEKTAIRLGANIFPVHSTVFAKVGAALLLNRRRMLIRPTVVDNNMMAAIPTNIDPDFLYHFLSSIDFANFVQTGALPSINQSVLGEIEIPDFILSEQRTIAEILSAIDQTIEKTEALIHKYQQIKAGLMHDLFTRGLTADGKLRPPREQAPELYKETPIGWIPKEWDYSALRDKAFPGIQHIRTGPFGSALKGEHWVEDGHPVITIGALGEGEFIDSELLYIGDFDVKRLSAFRLKLGEVVFSRVADVGRSVVIRENQVGWVMSSNLMRISLDRNQVMPEFLQYQLSGDTRIKVQIRRKVNSGGREVANSDILNRLIFAWPQFEEQDSIVKLTNIIDEKLQKEKEKKLKLQKQKVGLMHDLLTGRVRVKVNESNNQNAAA